MFATLKANMDWLFGRRNWVMEQQENTPSRTIQNMSNDNLYRTVCGAIQKWKHINGTIRYEDVLIQIEAW